MKKSLAVLALAAVFGSALSARAQDEPPKAELYLGYDYARVNSGGSGYNFNGGSGQFSYNPSQRLGLTGEFGGYYTGNGFRAGILSYMAGPRINLRGHGRVTPFVQALFGAARSIDFSPENTFAMTAGGGADIKISEHFAIRPVQAEYFLTKFTDGATNRQNNFRYSAGVIFRFGRG